MSDQNMLEEEFELKHPRPKHVSLPPRGADGQDFLVFLGRLAQWENDRRGFVAATPAERRPGIHPEVFEATGEVDWGASTA